MNNKIIISLSITASNKVLINVFEENIEPLIDKIEINFSSLKEVSDSIYNLVDRYYLHNLKNKKDIKKKLLISGKLLYQTIFKNKFTYKLHTNQIIIFSIDKDLLFIPFELIYDNKFWGLNYQIARQIKFKKTYFQDKKTIPLKTIILSNPSEDKRIENILAHERYEIYKTLKQNKKLKVNYPYAGRIIDKNFFINALLDNNILYFSGHSSAESKKKIFIELYNSKLTANQIKDFNLAHIFLFFLNSCQSSFVKNKNYFEVSLLYNFLKTGIKNYIGNMFNIKPQASNLFAVTFFKNFSKGKSIGEAILKARKKVFNKYKFNEIAWFSYNFYGNPEDKIKNNFKIRIKIIFLIIIFTVITPTLFFYKLKHINILFPIKVNDKRINQKTLAILPLKYYNNNLKAYAIKKTDSLYRKYNKKYTLVEREKLNKILEELKLSQSKYINKKRALQIGKLISAQYLLYGHIYKINNKIITTYRIINVATSEIVFIKTENN